MAMEASEFQFQELPPTFSIMEEEEAEQRGANGTRVHHRGNSNDGNGVHGSNHTRMTEYCDSTEDEEPMGGVGNRDRLHEGGSRTSIIFSNFEQALKVVGAFGAYQIGFVLCIQLSLILWCGNFVFMVYATYSPIVTCVNSTEAFELSEVVDGSSLVSNNSHVRLLTLNHDHPGEFCQVYEAGLCRNLTWTAPFYTVVQEWDLICDKDYIPQLFSSVQMAGTVIATIFSGFFSDFMGRKFVFYVTFALCLISSMASTLSTGPLMFAASRFFVGGMLSASIMVNFVWSMEITDQKHNVIVNCSTLWHFAYIVTAFIGWLTGSWTTYLLVINSLCAPLLIFYGFYHESPRWLIQNGQLDRAAKLLTKIADQNRPLHRVEISAENLSGIRLGASHLTSPTPNSNTTTTTSDTTDPVLPPQLGLRSLFAHSKLRNLMFVMMILFCATSASATAYIFQVSLLPGSPFMKFAIYGLLRSWIPFAIYFADRKMPSFGRRLMLLIPMALVFLCYLVVTISAMIGNYPTVLFVGTLSGAIICNALWVALGQYNIELFPTMLRNTAACIIGLCDPLVGVLMPQLIFLERHWRPLPFIFVTFFTGISLILTYYILPETKGRNLPDTLADIDSLPYAFQRDTGFTFNIRVFSTTC